MKNFFSKLFKLLSYIPFFKYFFKLFYRFSLKKIKEEFSNQNDIIDIILTSDLKSSDFTYGQSDLNLLIIVGNDCHPKIILKQIRYFIKSRFILSLTVNHIYIPILTKNELKTGNIKSFLIRKSYKDLVKWNSILFTKEYIFHLKKQDHFAIVFSSIQNLDYYLLKEQSPKSNRSKIKNIYRAIQNIRKIHPNLLPLDKSWKELSKLSQKIPFLSIFNSKKIMDKSWDILTNHNESYVVINKYQDFPIEPKFLKYLQKLLSIEFIDDVTLTPSIIQNNKDQITGKLFIDIHVNNSIKKKSYIQQIDNLRIGIKEYETSTLKIRVRMTTPFYYKLQNEYSYYPFPLEALYRKEKTFSVKKRQYNFLINHDQIICSSIHFLTTQFMRFRSLQQKTDLIGSKFIKSLNLMFKYFLLAEYLKGKEFKVEVLENKIREHLTPQFSDVGLDDPVSEEQWKIIEAQLQYLLKEIRDELVKYDPSLAILRF